MTDIPSPIRPVLLEGGPLDGRTLYWNGGRVMDVPVIEGTGDLIGEERFLEEGERLVDVRYVQAEDGSDVYRYAGGESHDPA